METNKFVTTSIILVVTLLLVFLFVVPKFHQSQALNTSLAKKQAQYDGESQYYQLISQTLASLQSKQEALDKVESALPGQDSLAPLLTFFQQQGKTSNVAVTSVAFAQDQPLAIAKTLPSANEKEVKNVKLVVELNGSYQSVKQFLEGVELSSRLIEVTSVSLLPLQTTQTSAQKKQPTYHVVLQVTTHTY